MEALATVALTFAIMALGMAAHVYIRLGNIEKKLKDFDVIPREFSSLEPEKTSRSQD